MRSTPQQVQRSPATPQAARCCCCCCCLGCRGCGFATTAASTTTKGAVVLRATAARLIRDHMYRCTAWAGLIHSYGAPQHARSHEQLWLTWVGGEAAVSRCVAACRHSTPGRTEAQLHSSTCITTSPAAADEAIS